MTSRTSSRGSRTSSKSSVSRYRTKAHQSDVDEMLFGNTAAESSKQTRQTAPLTDAEVLHFTTGQKVPNSKNKAKPRNRKPETVRVITKDLIRDVVVPSDDNGNQIILSGSQFSQIREKAKNTSVEEATKIKKQHEDRDKILSDMQKRKALMNEYDLKRNENAPISDLQAESRTIAEELLRRSQAKKLEENDEIKHLNELILEAKCHAIRDAQIAEKGQLQTQMNQENDRLDAMMEIDRVQAIQQQEDVVKIAKIQRQKGATQILQQIEANAMDKLLENEKKDQEARLLLESQRAIQMNDLAEIEKKRNEQKLLQEDIDKINKENQRLKTRQQEQDRIAELRVVEYQKEKSAREESLEFEQKNARRDKELEIAKLRAAQEKASNLQAERDALRAKRHEEATEREYRRKAREEACKKKAMDMEMTIAREEQITAKRHLMAVQAARERAEFDKTLSIWQSTVEQMEKDDQDRFDNQRTYAKEVRTQIKERESQRINERKTFFEETITMDKEIEAKNRQLEEVKLTKLRNLKESGVPEKYVSEVARRIGLTAEIQQL